MKTREAILLVLEREGITKYRLAKDLGIASTVSVNQWLRGTRMSVLVAERFKTVYSITISDTYDTLRPPNKLSQ